MALRLYSQTQQTRSPSAASHGVGLPVSDGGAGAVARALQTVGQSTANIAGVLQRRDDLNQQTAYRQISNKISIEATQKETDIETAVRSGNLEKASELKKNYQEWAESLDPNSLSYLEEKDGKPLPALRERLYGELKSHYQTQAKKNGIKFDSEISLAQTIQLVEKNYNHVSDSIKMEYDRFLTHGQIEASKTTAALSEQHRQLSESALVNEGLQGDPRFLEQAEGIRGAQLRDYADLFLKSQLQNPRINEVLSNVEFFKKSVGENAELYSEDDLNYVTNTLAKIKSSFETNHNFDPLRKRVSAALNTAAKGGLVASESLTEAYTLVDNASALPGLSQDEQTQLSEFRSVLDTYNYFTIGENLDAAVKWRQANPERSVQEYLDSDEFKKGMSDFVGESFDPTLNLSVDHINSVRNYISETTNRAISEYEKFGKAGYDAVVFPDNILQLGHLKVDKNTRVAFLESALEEPPQVDYSTPEGRTVMSEQDKINEYVTFHNKSGSYMESAEPVYTGLPEAVALMNKKDSLQTNAKIASRLIQDWGIEKATNFAASAQSFEDPDARHLASLIAMSIYEGPDGSVAITDQLETGFKVHSGNEKEKLEALGGDPANVRAFDAVNDYRYDEEARSEMLDIINTAAQSDMAVFAQAFDVRIAGVLADVVRTDPKVKPEDAWREVDRYFKKHYSMFQDSRGNPQFQIDWMQGDVRISRDGIMGFFERAIGPEISRKDYADVRSFRFFEEAGRMGAKPAELLTERYYGNNDPSDDSVAAKVKREIAKLKTAEEQTKYLMDLKIPGKGSFIRMNPIPTITSDGEPVLQGQVFNGLKYVPLLDKEGKIVTVPVSLIEKGIDQDEVYRVRRITQPTSGLSPMMPMVSERQNIPLTASSRSDLSLDIPVNEAATLREGTSRASDIIKDRILPKRKENTSRFRNPRNPRNR